MHLHAPGSVVQISGVVVSCCAHPFVENVHSPQAVSEDEEDDIADDDDDDE